MRRYWLKRDGNRELLVFVLGWAACHRVVGHIMPDGFDILCLYDYRDMSDDGKVRCFRQEVSDEIAAGGYSGCSLFAWSFGVWAAERIFGGGDGFTRAVALNGTPFPVNGLYGIEPRRLAVTVRGLRGGGMEPFNRKAYGEFYEQFEPLLSARGLEDNISELALLQSIAAEPYEPSVAWDRAVVGGYDEIFPPENMLRYWGARAEVLPLPHYPFADAGLIGGFLNK